MGLRQLTPINRIIFLKRFSTELLINSGKPGVIEKNIQKQIQIEKLKQKFLKPIDQEKEFQPSIFQRPVYQKREPVLYRLPIPKRPRIIKQQVKQAIQRPIRPAQVTPEIQPRPAELGLGKLDPLLKNKSIQSIECPGPGKNLLIKRYNKINATRITLNQVEITDIINNFAQQARIPITGGILKAAVGDLIISAVISEFVGSRFIINKITAYNLIQ